MKEPFHIVLVHPEIPQNTGGIGRLCVSTGFSVTLSAELSETATLLALLELETSCVSRILTQTRTATAQMRIESRMTARRIFEDDPPLLETLLSLMSS